MTGPVVYVSRFRIKPGKLDAFREYVRAGSDGIRSAKPRTQVFLAYLSEEGEEATFVHVFADAAAMAAHVEGAGERAKQAYAFMDPAGFDLYGSAGADLSAMIQAMAAPGVEVRLHPVLLGGFLRDDAA